MSYNTRYLADQENATRENKLNNKSKNSITTQDTISTVLSENAINNKSNAQSLRPGAKRGLRQPLRGKDQNKTIPNLQRSKTTLNSTQDTKFKRVPLSKKPLLSKANSSLGFTPTGNSFNDILNYDSNPLSATNPQLDKSKNITLQEVKNNIFENSIPTRSKTLVEPASTDSLIKTEKQLLGNYEWIRLLSSTISSRTEELNSSNAEDMHLKKHDVDPIKKSPKRKSHRNHILSKASKSRKSVDGTARPFHIHKDFAESEDEIEYVPKKEPELSYIPFDIEPLSLDDLQFISSRNSGNISSNPDERNILNLDDELNGFSEVMDSENDEYDLKELHSEVQHDENLGLQIDDLNDLLDI